MLQVQLSLITAAKKKEVVKKNVRPQTKAVLDLLSSDADSQDETEGKYVYLHHQIPSDITI